jgi:cyclophilin family peptidyl-prolyl cis-trans isomerase
VPAARAAADGERPLADLVPADRNGMFTEPPDLTIDPAANYYATIVTEKGDIVVQLFADRAPVTVNNFVHLANQGFYDGTTFHRVLDGFMAQAGDPTGTGAGGPGYQFQDEFAPGLVFDRPGLLAMANAGPGTNGSQFFITFSPTEWLDGRHTIFGEVVEGNEVLGQLTRRDPSAAPDFEGDLIEAIYIETRDESVLPTPTPLPPTPTPYAPTSLEGDRPLSDVPVEERDSYFNTPPDLVIDPSKNYAATIATSRGDLEIELNTAEAPTAVNNFVVLANLGFYDGLPLIVVPEQVVLFGALNDNQDSDVGYTFTPELGLEPARGSLAYVALQPVPNEPPASSGSQILIALMDPPAETAQLYSFFGAVVAGDELLDTLTPEDTIESITIREE